MIERNSDTSRLECKIKYNGEKCGGFVYPIQTSHFDIKNIKTIYRCDKCSATVKFS